MNGRGLMRAGMLTAAGLMLAGCMTVDYRITTPGADVRLTPPTPEEQRTYHLVYVRDSWKSFYAFYLFPLNEFDLNEMVLGGYIHETNPQNYPVRELKARMGMTVLDGVAAIFLSPWLQIRTVTYEGTLLAPAGSQREWERKDEAVQVIRERVL
jgi:hypothetical protein